MGHAVRRCVDKQIVERLRLHGLTFARDGLIVFAAYLIAELARFDADIPRAYWVGLIDAFPFLLFVYSTVDYVFGIHRRIWQYAGARDLRALIDSAVLSGSIILLSDVAFGREFIMPISVACVGSVVVPLGLLLVRCGPRLLRRRNALARARRILIVGAGECGQHVASDLMRRPDILGIPVAFVDDDAHLHRMRIHGIKVLGTVSDIPEIVRTVHADTVAIALPGASHVQLERVLRIAQQTDARIQILPWQFDALQNNAEMKLQDIRLNDLLPRKPPSLEDLRTLVADTLAGRVVLVTGGAGSIGSEICRQLLRLNISHVIALDNNETSLFHLEQELRGHGSGARITTVLADITDADRLEHVFAELCPNVVFHTAAYKHVPMLESHPAEAVKVNVLGTLNLCRATREAQCERFVFISTDKAVNPVNVLGFSKRIGELLVRSHHSTQTAFCSVRFGNVIGSRGSALPEFVRQIDAGGPVKVTHPDVERYFMTIAEAVSLVIQAGSRAEGGELFMLDMGEPIKIVDLARRLIRLRGLRIGQDIDIEYTGLRPGEKMTEQLTFTNESTQPTASETIYVVRDPIDVRASLLEQGISSLVQIAERGDIPRLRTMLAGMANGNVGDVLHVRVAGD